MPQEFITRSAEETFDLAYRIGESLEGGEVFLLSGDLGAGKTVFTKGIAAGLEIDPADVTSPTFTLINAHAGSLLVRVVAADTILLQQRLHMLGKLLFLR